MTALAFLLTGLAAGFTAGSIPIPLDQMLRVDKMTEGDEFALDMDRIQQGSLMDNTAGEAAEVAAEHTPTPAEAKKIENLRFSGIRLQAIVLEEDMLRPWVHAAQEQTFVGSGFVVRNTKERGPLIITNSHVVTGANRLTIQVPAAGQQSYEARVALNNPDMDIALVELATTEERRNLVKDVGFALPTIKLFKGKAKVGEPVMTMGFPLGQNSVKVSKGVLSGHEKVGDFMAYQQTAPISPGNSGGPLFKDGTTEVLGINYAAAVGESSQNNNYAIPAWHINQMLHEYDATASPLHAAAEGVDDTGYSNLACRTDHARCTYRVPRMKASASEGNDGLYERFGCESGIFVNKIEKGSIALSAEPPIPEKSFIMTVDGQDVDKSGMIKTDMYFGDPVVFTELMFIGQTLKPVEMKVCTCGEVTTHKVHTSSLQTKHEPEDAIADAMEPSLVKVDYEQFGGVTVQPLSLSIIKQLAQGPMKRMDMLRFAVSKRSRETPKLVVTAVSKINDRTGTINVGDIVHTVNGKKTSTMAEYRAAFEPTGHEADDADAGQCSTGGHMWTLETESGKELAEDYHDAMKEQRAAVMKGEKPLTPAVQKAMEAGQHAPVPHSPALPSMVEAKVKPSGEPIPVEQRQGLRRGGADDFDIIQIFKAASA